MTLLLPLVIRPSIILLAGLVLARLLAKRSAAVRHFVLAATIAAAAAVMPLSLAVPAWEITLPAPVPGPAVPHTPETFAQRPSATRHAGENLALRAQPGVAVPFVWILWAAGFIGTAGALLTGVLRLVRITSRAERIHEGPWSSFTRAIAAAYGLRREVVLLHTDVPDLLATWGALRPCVLLPSSAREWPDDRVRVVLCHELAHIRRHDWAVQMGAEALLTFAWFNPLMWIACRRLRRESEQACDDAVLGRGVPAHDYAAHLLELARKCRRPIYPWASAMPMAHPSTLERRIAAMLNPALNRTALSRRAAWATTALLLALTLPLAAFRTVQGTPAALTGSVYDPTGAVIPGVELTLEDARQATLNTTTGADGRFAFPNVGPGRYVLATALPGFRALRQEFELTNARDWDRAITLQLGELSETINVSEKRVAVAGPTQPRAAQRIRVGGNIRVPRKEVDVRPVYPQTMREAGREGVVPIEAIIGIDGTVTSLRVLSAQVHPDFAIAASDAVRQWKFSPTLLNGQPVEVAMRVSITFSLSE
jgi:TonB family protein